MAGFQPVMPTFQGLVSEEQLLALIEYIKSLKARPAGQPAPTRRRGRRRARRRPRGAAGPAATQPQTPKK